MPRSNRHRKRSCRYRVNTPSVWATGNRRNNAQCTEYSCDITNYPMFLLKLSTVYVCWCRISHVDYIWYSYSEHGAKVCKLRRQSKTAQPLVCADRPNPPRKLTVPGPFVYRDQILLLH